MTDGLILKNVGTQSKVEFIVGRNPWEEPTSEESTSHKGYLQGLVEVMPPKNMIYGWSESYASEAEFKLALRKRNYIERQLMCNVYYYTTDVKTGAYKRGCHTCDAWRYKPELGIRPCPLCYARRIGKVRDTAMRSLVNCEDRKCEARVLVTNDVEFDKLVRAHELTADNYSRMPLPDGKIQVIIAPTKPEIAKLGEPYTMTDIRNTDWENIVLNSKGNISGKLGRAPKAAGSKDEEETFVIPTDEPQKYINWQAAPVGLTRTEKENALKRAQSRTKDIPTPKTAFGLSQALREKALTIAHEFQVEGAKQVYAIQRQGVVPISCIDWSGNTEKSDKFGLARLTEAELLAAQHKIVGYDPTKFLLPGEEGYIGLEDEEDWPEDDAYKPDDEPNFAAYEPDPPQRRSQEEEFADYEVLGRLIAV